MTAGCEQDQVSETSTDCGGLDPLGSVGNAGKTGERASGDGTRFRRPHSIYVADEKTRNAITFGQAERFIQAAGHARAIGLPLRYHLCVRWGADDWADRTKLMELIQKFLSQTDGQAAFVWVNEGKGGAHTHVLLHCQKHLKHRLDRKIRRFVASILGAPRPARGQVHFRRFDWRYGDKRSLKSQLKYLLKAGDEATRRFFGVSKLEETVVPSKRIGVSQALGEAARKRSGGVLPTGLRQPTDEMMRMISLRKVKR